MIPKIIHYCWLSKNPIPTEARECIESWKRFMPDWTLKLWNMDNFDIHSVPFVEEAVNAEKWAFASDYIRLYALYTEGGVYFDSDVLVRKPMDFVLDNRAFSAVEYFPHLAQKLIDDGLVDVAGNKLNQNAKIHGIQVQAAIMGAEKGHPFFGECLEHYRNTHFDFGNSVPSEDAISPIVLAGIAESYGFKYRDQEQDLSEGFKLYPSSIFCSQPYLMKPEAVAVHCCNASWRKTLTKKENYINNLKIRTKAVLNFLKLRSEKSIERIK